MVKMINFKITELEKAIEELSLSGADGQSLANLKASIKSYNMDGMKILEKVGVDM